MYVNATTVWIKNWISQNVIQINDNSNCHYQKWPNPFFAPNSFCHTKWHEKMENHMQYGRFHIEILGIITKLLGKQKNN
tara:strand:+ start:199 stop:435 length:237 start_codon:yes stop_codon:yes gene_type:complete